MTRTLIIFKLGFIPLVEGENFSFESDEHPNLDGFIASQEDPNRGKDIVLDVLTIKERAAAISQQEGYYLDQEALMNFVDVSKTSREVLHDIGNAPDLLRGSAGNKELLLKHDQPKRGSLSRKAEKSIQDARFFSTLAAEARERRE